jgi:hypothetical protein
LKARTASSLVALGKHLFKHNISQSWTPQCLLSSKLSEQLHLVLAIGRAQACIDHIHHIWMLVACPDMVLAISKPETR